MQAVHPQDYIALVYFPVAIRLDPVSGRVFCYEDSRFSERPPEPSAEDKAKLTLARIKVKALSMKPSLKTEEQVELEAYQGLVAKFQAPPAPKPGEPQAVINLQQIMIVEGTNFIPRTAWEGIRLIKSQQQTIQRCQSQGAMFVIELSNEGRRSPKRSSLDFNRVDDLKLIVDNCKDIDWLQRSRSQDISREAGIAIHDNLIERLEFLSRQSNKQEGQRKVALV